MNRIVSSALIVNAVAFLGVPVSAQNAGDKPSEVEWQGVYPTVVVINEHTPYPVQLLIDVFAHSINDKQTVELCNVDLDFTGYSNIVLGKGRSLIASRGCERGLRNRGPRIFVTDKRDSSRPLLKIRDSNVKISGFRLQGPTNGIGSGDDNVETGIQIAPFEEPEPGVPMVGVEISNMEISCWSGIGIDVEDISNVTARGRLFNTNVNAVKIANNYIHHNRHYDREGYGVKVGGGAYALIERDVFEGNRHGIAGGSRDGLDYSGYTVRENLILPGGGLHCNYLACWQTHQIDMHGDEDDFHKGGGSCCGRAGETLIIERNTILYTGGYRMVPSQSGEVLVWSDGLAIKIRGNPIDKGVIDGNVFRLGTRSDAIAQNGNPGWGDNITNPLDVRKNNVFGADPMATLAVVISLVTVG